jgi:hypothetical protein
MEAPLSREFFERTTKRSQASNPIKSRKAGQMHQHRGKEKPPSKHSPLRPLDGPRARERSCFGPRNGGGVASQYCPWGADMSHLGRPMATYCLGGLRFLDLCGETKATATERGRGERRKDSETPQPRSNTLVPAMNRFVFDAYPSAFVVSFLPPCFAPHSERPQEDHATTRPRPRPCSPTFRASPPAVEA